MSNERTSRSDSTKKRRLRFTLRAMLVLVLVASIPCWWVASLVSQFTVERKVAEKMAEINPRTYLLWENQTPEWIASLGVRPRWMDRIVRVDATGLSSGQLSLNEYPMAQTDFDDAKLSDVWDDLNQLECLREVYFQMTSISDKSLDALASLTELEILNLQETNVTDVAAKELRAKLAETKVWHY